MYLIIKNVRSALRNSRIVVVALLLLLHCCCYCIVVVIALLLHCYCIVIALLLHCYCIVIVIILYHVDGMCKGMVLTINFQSQNSQHHTSKDPRSTGTSRRVHTEDKLV